MLVGPAGFRLTLIHCTMEVENRPLNELDRLADEYNSVLAKIVQSLQTYKDLGPRLHFSIQRKNERWRDVYQFMGPDHETVALLSEYWDRADFSAHVGQVLTPLTGNHSPITFAGAQCLLHDRKDALGTVARRALMLNFSRMEKHYNLSVDEIAALLMVHFPGYAAGELYRRTKELLRRGSVLDSFVKDVSPGIILVFGKERADLSVSSPLDRPPP